ncbi:MAG: hypothetical protein KF874_08080 [Rhizobiaceae bacterium]|nr:hypothetical protein [Rhizobiaceae bacterium]
MSDFVGVLKKTLEGLGETSPEMRQRVYDKARSTISAKLAGMNPPPPAGVADRQRRALEDAIAEVERSFAPPAPARHEPLDELESVLNSLNGLKNEPVVPPRPRQPEPPRPIVQPRPVTTPTSRPPVQHQQPVAAQPDPVDQEDEFDPLEDDRYDSPPPNAIPLEPEPRRGYGRLVATLLLLVALAGGGYAAWMNRDQLSAIVADLTQSQPQSGAAPEATPEVTENATPAEGEGGRPANGPVKFTQKLNPDGSESDVGPAGSQATIGEGASVASATDGESAPEDQAGAPDQAAPQEEGTDSAEEEAPVDQQPAETAQAPEAEQAPPAQSEVTQDAQTAVAVGQQAIFYEERTNSADGSAERGSIVWSVVQESPGADQPPEPAIRAEATIPGKELQLRMTIRRNADATLPASHIVEMIFLTPENFEGGGIDNVLRIALKSSEQDAGTPLSGIPAKISDGFFLIALNDSPQDKDANMRLLLERSWLDVPLVYKSGRRALITMEKGIPGEKVFDDVLKSWGVQTSG